MTASDFSQRTASPLRANDLSILQRMRGQQLKGSDIPSFLKGVRTTLHKTEAGLVMVGLASGREVSDGFKMLKSRSGNSFSGGFLVQEMVKGDRELMIGMTRDEQFGPSVMFGLGSIFTEVLEDVSFSRAAETVRCA